jgi:hypothetical protein
MTDTFVNLTTTWIEQGKQVVFVLDTFRLRFISVCPKCVLVVPLGKTQNGFVTVTGSDTWYFHKKTTAGPRSRSPMVNNWDHPGLGFWGGSHIGDHPEPGFLGGSHIGDHPGPGFLKWCFDTLSSTHHRQYIMFTFIVSSSVHCGIGSEKGFCSFGNIRIQLN